MNVKKEICHKIIAFAKKKVMGGFSCDKCKIKFHFSCINTNDKIKNWVCKHLKKVENSKDFKNKFESPKKTIEGDLNLYELGKSPECEWQQISRKNNTNKTELNRKSNFIPVIINNRFQQIADNESFNNCEEGHVRNTTIYSTTKGEKNTEKKVAILGDSHGKHCAPYLKEKISDTGISSVIKTGANHSTPLKMLNISFQNSVRMTG